jgi:hypothetical protein
VPGSIPCDVVVVVAFLFNFMYIGEREVWDRSIGGVFVVVAPISFPKSCVWEFCFAESGWSVVPWWGGVTLHSVRMKEKS